MSLDRSCVEVDVSNVECLPTATRRLNRSTFVSALVCTASTLTTMSEPSSTKSFLDLVNLYDNVHIDWSSSTDPNFESEHLITWYLSPSPGSPAIGLLRPLIVDQLRKENEICQSKGLPDVWVIVESSQGAISLKPRICFNSWVDNALKRTAVMKELCERWRDTGLFENVCGPKKWRGELYPVYANPFGVRDYLSKDGGSESVDTNFAFEMERSACALFGVVTFGVHMTIYQDVEGANSGEKNTYIWVPTRAKTKQTYVPPPPLPLPVCC
jgi:hypothetical protein